ncbi:hypothetical protein K438DRAFT_1970423 [Mycena galopus ATCC 62051]|nr:hypothetical protein K438DRAFT_1970423 [Mycena galopus ATCC 62051]
MSYSLINFLAASTVTRITAAVRTRPASSNLNLRATRFVNALDSSRRRSGMQLGKWALVGVIRPWLELVRRPLPERTMIVSRHLQASTTFPRPWQRIAASPATATNAPLILNCDSAATTLPLRNAHTDQ